MKLDQNVLENIKDRRNRGLITAAQANVEIIKARRVYLVTGRVFADVRKALNAAVKAGELKHLKKDGRKPECYYHPTFEYMVAGARNDHERSILIALSAVCA